MKKLSVEIPNEDLIELNKLLDFGARSAIYRQLTVMVIVALQEQGPKFVHNLITGKIKFSNPSSSQE